MLTNKIIRKDMGEVCLRSLLYDCKLCICRIGAAEKATARPPKRETEFGMPCICASYIYINYGNCIHVCVAFEVIFHVSLLRKREKKEKAREGKAKAKGPPVRVTRGRGNIWTELYFHGIEARGGRRVCVSDRNGDD